MNMENGHNNMLSDEQRALVTRCLWSLQEADLSIEEGDSFLKREYTHCLALGFRELLSGDRVENLRVQSLQNHQIET